MVLIGERGVLVTGASGSGKTTLALTLIDHYRQRGLFSRLISDDQLFVEAHAGRLVCRAPAAIEGLVEVPGLGPRPLPFEPAGLVDLHVRLMPAGETVRFQEEASSSSIAGCLVPRIDVAERNVTAALPAVMARLSIAPFL
jgi:serine kinase of HPr protein (carbohydrate metabolism regulator)